MKGDQLGSAVRQRLGKVEAGREYRVATIDYFQREYANELGVAERVEPAGQLLRDALVTHARSDRLQPLVS